MDGGEALAHLAPAFTFELQVCILNEHLSSRSTLHNHQTLTQEGPAGPPAVVDGRAEQIQVKAALLPTKHKAERAGQSRVGRGGHGGKVEGDMCTQK